MHSGIQSNHREEDQPDLCDTVDRRGDHYVKQNELAIERQVLRDLIQVEC